MSIVLLLNPRSRANRRDPHLRERLAALLGGAGRVAATESLDQLSAVAAELAVDPPTAFAVHGGDGTLHKALTALLQAFGDRPLPPVAILPGGTMNVVSASLDLQGPPEALVAQLVAQTRAPSGLTTIDRRCLRVDNRYGFVFGNGLMANFLEEYYAVPNYGTRRAVWLLARTVGSELAGGPYARRIFRPFEGRVILDGQPLPWRRLLSVGAATVTEVGLGFKLNHRADDDPTRFAALAIFGPPLGLALDLLAVRRGRGISPERAWSALGSRLELLPDRPEEPNLYTLDGDLYAASGPLRVELGPTLRLFKPR